MDRVLLSLTQTWCVPICIVPCGKVISHLSVCKARWSSTHDALLCSFPVAHFQSPRVLSEISHSLRLDPLTPTYSSHCSFPPLGPAESATLTCSGTGHRGQSVYQFERRPWCIAINFNGSCQHSPSSSAGMECKAVPMTPRIYWRSSNSPSQLRGVSEIKIIFASRVANLPSCHAKALAKVQERSQFWKNPKLQENILESSENG